MELGEIVVVEPLVDQGRPECSSPAAAPARRISRTRTANYVPNYFDSETLPLGISDKIQRFLRVANEIRDESPRTSYMCRFHAFAKAHEIDPSSAIRGVRQLKTALISQLERQKEENSVRELYRVYMKYQNIIRSCEVHDTTVNRDVQTKAHAIASVLYEVLADVSPGVTLPVPETPVYNILPLGSGGAQHVIMKFPEIKATIAALRKIRGLPWPNNHYSSGDNDMDLLDWLQCWFRFQVYGISWLVIITFFVLIKISIEGRRRLNANSHALYKLLKAVLFLSFLSILIVHLSLCGLSGKDLFICALAFLPTGWGLLLVAQAIRPLMEKVGIWDSVQVVARSYDYGMGFLLFAPLAVLAFIPSVSEFQTRLLFNQAFSRRLQIQPILKGKRKNKSPP